MQRYLSGLAAVLAIGATMAAFATPSEAALTLKLTQGASTVTVADGDADGIVVFNGALGVFNVNVSTGLSKPTLGGPASPHIDLNSIDVSSAAGALTIMLSDDGFTGPVPAHFQTAIGGTTQGAVSVASFLDNSNAIFGMATPLSALGPFGGPAFAATGGAGAVPTAPYSLTLLATITHTGAGQVSSFDAQLRTVPEPTALGLAGIGLASLGFAIRRRKKVS